MSAGAICIAVLLLLFLAVPVTFGIMREEKRREWPKPTWWQRPINGPGLRQSIRPICEPAPAQHLEAKDPRIVGGRR